jgi:hypothetical protein
MITGFKVVRREDLPYSIREESKNGVPECLWGWSVLQGPKVLRYLFFLDVSYNIMEDDLVAAHLNVMHKLVNERGIPSRELTEYLCSAESVQSKREEWAAQTGATVKEVKTLTTMVGYGNAGTDWMLDHDISELPKDIVGIRNSLRLLTTALWTEADDERKAACNCRPHPALTNLSIEAQRGERQMLDAKAVQIGAHDSRVCGFIFDSVVSVGVTGPPPLTGVDTKCSSISMTVEAYKAFVVDRYGEPHPASVTFFCFKFLF